MTDDSTTQCLLFAGLAPKPIFFRFDDPLGSSDGGAILLKAADSKLGLSARLAECVRDERVSGKVKHEIVDLIVQRVMAIACGYADCNDAGRLADDPVQKMLAGHDPVAGAPLASQPTLSRFENEVDTKDLYRMGQVLAETVVERHRQRLRGRARKITIDLDPTDDPTHGAQQLSFFNGHYDSWCYLPIVGFLTFDNEPEQYLFTAVLRPGNAPAKLGAIGILERILDLLRPAFPKARFRVRLDGGFGSGEMFDFLESQPNLDYAVAMAKNVVLDRRVRKLMRKARRKSRGLGQTAHLYGEIRYRAKKWGRKRRVIVKAEVVRHPGREPKDNPRFVVTNLPQTPKWIYEEIYCGRGEIENRIKELHHGLEIDRTSCTRFWANQFRVLLTAAAYVLMQEIRLCAAGTSYARAQVSTLRDRLLKIGVRVVESVRRIVFHLPASFPDIRAWCQIAHRLGAQTG